MVVEGYFDVLALAEAGVSHVVASLGTALTLDQLHLLRRFTRDIVVCFDGDAAGARAAEKSLATFLEAGLWGIRRVPARPATIPTPSCSARGRQRRWRCWRRRRRCSISISTARSVPRVPSPSAERWRSRWRRGSAKSPIPSSTT